MADVLQQRILFSVQTIQRVYRGHRGRVRATIQREVGWRRLLLQHVFTLCS